jgi:hypothetical protein
VGAMVGLFLRVGAGGYVVLWISKGIYRWSKLVENSLNTYYTEEHLKI